MGRKYSFYGRSIFILCMEEHFLCNVRNITYSMYSMEGHVISRWGVFSHYVWRNSFARLCNEQFHQYEVEGLEQFLPRQKNVLTEKKRNSFLPSSATVYNMLELIGQEIWWWCAQCSTVFVSILSLGLFLTARDASGVGPSIQPPVRPASAAAIESMPITVAGRTPWAILPKQLLWI